MINLEEALKIAKKFLNNEDIRIVICTKLKEGYTFAYEGKIIENEREKWYPVVNNALVFVDKNGIADYYIITEHFKELLYSKKIKIDTTF